MHQKRRGRFFPKDGIQLPACCASAAWTARPSGGRRPVSVACQGRPLKNGPSGAGLSGAGSTAGVPEGAVSAVAAEDGGCGVRFLSPRLLRAYLPLSVLQIKQIRVEQLVEKWIIPELIGHTIVTVLMLISLHWFIFLLNLPVATWNIYRFIMVPSGNMGVFDPTEIHNRGQLKSHMKEAMVKLGFHLLCFFMYLYSMILALIND
ncbi:protein cornichon homolog 4 isoform X1 [Manis pentadactyla]|uniref:protein cornichon homolog 4 isoform X1 n=2 Tax=Manis TaxID=9973 RepID=UPI00255CA624|nr:protein cornichon homolog 4 isoform X1 [Manis pentadactyla]